MTDCLILGFYDYPFPQYVKLVRSMGEASGAYRDLALSFIEWNGTPHRALDILTKFYNEGRAEPVEPFHNADFLWPVISYLTTYLYRRGFSPEYINLPLLCLDTLRSKLQGTQVRAIAITTTLYVSALPIVEMVKLCRRWNPRVPIVVGGPFISTQATSLPRRELNSLFSYIGGDIYVLCQEGEATLAATLGALKAGTSLAAVPNLAYRRGPAEFSFTFDSAEANGLAENLVDYSLFPKEAIGQYVTTRTAKSCPFACAFCAFPTRAGRYNYLDVAYVEKELNAIADIGTVSMVTIIDDTFNVPKGRFKEILRMMIRNGYQFKWNCFYRCDHGDDETIDLMAAAGCEGVFLGVESGSDEILERMNKTARRKDYLNSMPRLNRAGISVYASFIIGFPGETEATIRETLALIEATQPEFYRAQLWYADPVTPIWKERERYEIVGAGFNWKHSTMDAARACDAIDQIFVTVENSTWMPQLGFEQWSTFYLQRRGMTRDQVRQFVASFNAVIRHRLTTGDPAPPPELVGRLRASCHFEARQ